MLLLFPTGAAAAEIVASGTCGENLTWTLDNYGVLTISGVGSMENYYSDPTQQPWYSYRNEIETVVINKGVSSIGDSAFISCESLKRVDIPDGLLSIGKSAFCWCALLENITIPQSVDTIGATAFRGCSVLKEIVLPDGLTRIDDRTFYECTALKTVIIPDSLTAIGEHAFHDCPALEQLAIPDSVNSIGKYAFSNCTGLKYINIPDGLTIIGDHVLYNCKSLENIIINTGATIISWNAFQDCNSLKSITIPDSITEIKSYAFSGCTALTDVYYTGSRYDWEQITIGSADGNNSYLTGATIHYNSAGPETTISDIAIEISHGKPLETYTLTQSFESLLQETNSTTYNPKLSYVLAMMARAAYDFQTVDQNIKNLGFNTLSEDDYIFDYANDYTTAYTIAKKTTEEGSTIVLITIRGSYDLDWVTDFDIGWGMFGYGWHEGFEKSEKEIYAALEEMLGGILTKKTKYIITGHSQGAGVGNLLAVKLSDAGVPNADVYAYNFACPNTASGVATLFNPGGKHDNIFNICNIEDTVTFLPGHIGHVGELIGAVWSKYGQNLWFTPLSHYAVGHDMKYYVETLSTLPSFGSFFSLDLVSNIKRGFGIFCPVDIIVYDSSNVPIASVIENQVNYYDSDVDDVIIIIHDDEKLILVPDNEEYRIELSATENGEMQYWSFTVDLARQATIEEKLFDNVGLTPGKQMYSEVGGDIETEDISLYVIDPSGTPISEVHEDGTETPVRTIVSPFTDVYNDTYYADAVAWAVANGITSGTSATTFSPNDGCTRAQVVTFLWRAAGSPEVTGETVFSDVPAGQYYTKAVAWAVANNITVGVGDDKFAPNDTCTRGQIVTFLWRYENSPAASGASFSDVPSSAFYAEPVAWAVANGITVGVGNNRFAPNDTCTRAQIVTLLYRDMKDKP